MGLFDKKYCSVCGEKIGFLGNRKLEDGNLCKECARKLSPWFDDRRHSTVDQIKAQLDYREANKAAVEAFQVTRSFGKEYKIYLDEDAQKFLVTRSGNFREENPDVLDFSMVTGCDLDISEDEEEILFTNKEGEKVSYNPPRFSYTYDFDMILRVNHPYFDDMKFRLNPSGVEIRPNAMGIRSLNPRANRDYAEYEQMGNEIRETLMQVRQEAREQAAQANAPKVAVTCPWCGATVLPDANGCCEYCGGALNG